MPACIRIEAEALKLHITVDELRRLVKTGLIETIERDGGYFLTEESASKVQLMLELLRTRKLNLTQVAQILARQAPPYRLDDVRWI
jgi:Mn-dependent DtxR family transcriptional regulator